MQNLAEIVTAVTLAHSMHAFGEAKSVNNKTQRLTDAVAGKALKPYPANINTRTKSYAIGIGLFLVSSVALYFLIGLSSLDVETLLTITLAVIVLTDISGTINFDKYHVVIEKLIKKFEKKGSK